MRNEALIILVLVSAVLLFSAGDAHAYSVSAYFNAMNATVGINQNVFFNFSGYFPQNSSYTIYLGNKPVLSGVIPANSTHVYVLTYNVTNTEYGSYQSYITFSALTSHLPSDTGVAILPAPDFGFSSRNSYTYAFNRSKTLNNITSTLLEASLTIGVVDNGNTPLNVTWLIPTVGGVLFSLNYIESFGLLPGHVFNIPINLTLTKQASPVINFSFVGSFGSQSMRKNYITTLVSPVVNMSFSNVTIQQINVNKSEFTASITNGNNIPINTTFRFLLEIDKGLVVYNVSKVISPSSSSVSFTIPNARVVNVTAFYPSKNGTFSSASVYYNPLPLPPISLTSMLASYGYLVVFVAAITVLIIIHLRVRKGRKRKI